jgi:(1->4)-alpha-D-glucan 1-alpha-D-glucosylmutase
MQISRLPVATYRLQLNSKFRFADAAAIAPYLQRLGISDLYSSPIFTARRGSTHGYDVVDAREINPELGGEADFDYLSSALRERNLGFILDIVPNHMAASPENRWWMDVLEFGSDSPYASYFDVVWEPISSYGGVRNRLLLPVLGRPYGEALEAHELKLDFERGEFFLLYYERRIPLSPRTYPLILRQLLERTGIVGGEWTEQLDALSVTQYWHDLSGGEICSAAEELKGKLASLHEKEPEFRSALAYELRSLNGDATDAASFDKLDLLLEAQPYRLAYWRMAAEEINYRRFFDVTDLVGVRIESQEVFDQRHERLFELIEEGKVSGIRIDHIDGLFDPLSYLRRLKARLAPSDDSRFYTVVEKILARGEVLPESFPVEGTTGYDYLNIVNDVFVDETNLARLSEIYSSFSAVTDSPETIAYESKKKVINGLFAGEMRSLAASLSKIAISDRNARDFPFVELLQALTEVTASLSIYRTYVRDFHVADDDARYINEAVSEAQQRNRRNIDPRLFDFIRRVLLLEIPRYVEERRDWLDFVQRWQQFTGRSMAKGVEDTAFYVYNRLISLNEVGGEPGAERADVIETFHRWNASIREAWPHTLNTTSTHDTKRSEDVRARINVLSEIPDLWEAKLRRWGRTNHALKREVDGVLAPDRNEEAFIYQTLLGVWPLGEHDNTALLERLQGVIEKSLREAKVNTSWLDTRIEYERAVIDFVRALLDSGNREFLDDFQNVADTVAFYGFVNALGQQLLKITSPGVPDFYQGSELWDFSLVDPDNRRSVDFHQRERILDQLDGDDVSASLLLSNWKDGRIKMFTALRALSVRREHASLFATGSYDPLYATGDALRRVCAYGRSAEGMEVITVVPRMLASFCTPGELPLGQIWGESRLLLPAGYGQSWRNGFTGETVMAQPLAAGEQAISLADSLRSFPIAVLVRVE